MSTKDKFYHYLIDGINVDICGSYDQHCGWGLQFYWSINDLSENRNLVTGPFDSLNEALNDVKEHIKIYGKYKNIYIFTSYFDNINYLKKYGYTNLISIAGNTPENFNGRKYLELAPKYDWWKQWKDNKLSNQWYKQKYYETVLNKLDPIKVRKDLGDRAVLLCYEKPNEFCHRQLVAKWFKEKLGDEVNEF